MQTSNPLIRKSTDSQIPLYVLLIVVFLSRLPFLFHGYGTDGDAWTIVQSGFNLYSDGVYKPSRFPGYPLPEFFSGAVWLTNLPFIIPWIFNFISTLLSIAAVYYFFLIAGLFIDKQRYFIYLAAAAFAFVPVFYINSTSMMDYNWAIAFVLGSIYYLISKRTKTSAVFLALAAGCRITSALFIIPVVYYLISSIKNNSHRRKVFVYVLIFSMTALILFSPLIFKYGVTFLTFYRPPAEYSFINIVGRMTVRVWGFTGSLGILYACILLFLNKQIRLKELIAKNKITGFLLISFLLYVLLFLSLPLDAGYLIPAVPPVILLFYKILSGRILIYISILIIASPLILNVEKDNLTLAGPVFINSDKRISEQKYINDVINKAESFKKPGIIICESFLHKIEVTMKLRRGQLPANAEFIYMIPFDSLKSIAGNKEIYYLKNVREQNLKVYNYDLRAFGGKEF